MNFTEGKDLAFEQLMRQKPYSPKPKRGSRGYCPYCRYWDAQTKRCAYGKCVLNG